MRFFIFKRLGIALLENLMLSSLVLWASLFYLEGSFSPYPNISLAALKALSIALIFQIFLHLRGAYDFKKTPSLSEDMVRVAGALLLASLTLWGLYLLCPRILFGQGTFMRILVMSSVFLMVWHALLRFYFKIRPPRSNIVMLGTGDLARNLVREILRRPELGIGVSGFLGDDPALVGVSIVNPKVIGLYQDLPQIIASKKVNQIVVELQDRRGRLPTDELLKCKISRIGVEEATSFYERVTGKIAVENLKPSWMIFNPGFDVSKGYLAIKQIVATSLSFLALLLLSPVLLLVMILIKLDSPGPIFFKQERVGKNGKIFTLWKFRSMHQDAERETGPVWAKKDDPRVTRFGRFLRRSRLDELPQLYNILRGEMCLVGPRPERPSFVSQLSAMTPYYQIRLSVMPGLTGWAQINHRYASSVEDSVEKLQYDLFYIKHMSIALDLLIMFETIKTVLVQPGS